MSANQLRIRHFLLWVVYCTDYSLAHCEPFDRHTQTGRCHGNKRRFRFSRGLAQLAAAALDGLTAESGELVDRICGVALDPGDPFKRIIEFVGYDLSERSRNAGAQLDFPGHDGNASVFLNHEPRIELIGRKRPAKAAVTRHRLCPQLDRQAESNHQGSGAFEKLPARNFEISAHDRKGMLE